MFLINLLIIIFIILITYQVFVAYSYNLIENLETQDAKYEDYDTNNPNNALILAQQNAGNISIIKRKMDNLDGIKDDVENMQQNMDTMQTQIDGLVSQQAEYATEMSGGSEPPIIDTLINMGGDVNNF